jgi:nucleotide-binding universal stress UspA family protein
MIQNLKKILVPIDFSEFSFRALAQAHELAKDVGAELHLLHVVVPHMTLIPLALARDVELTREMAREASMVSEAEEELARIKKDQLGGSAKVSTSVVSGPPVLKIGEYAKDHHIDLILLSTHGRTGIEHMLIGSVAEKLVRTAPCSVLVLRTQPQ